MSTFNYLVTVETERESGLIVSRDEQSEKIVSVFDDLYSAELDSLGARSDSTYRVTEVEYQELEKRDLKTVNAEYDQAVRDAEPTDKELHTALREAKAEAAKWKDMYTRQKAIVDQIAEGDPLAGSKVYQEPRKWINDDEPRLNLSDRDAVYFQFGPHRSERLAVRFSNYDDGSIEVTADTMGREFAVMPQSGNVVRIRVVDR